MSTEQSAVSSAYASRNTPERSAVGCVRSTSRRVRTLCESPGAYDLRAVTHVRVQPHIVIGLRVRTFRISYILRTGAYDLGTVATRQTALAQLNNIRQTALTQLNNTRQTALAQLNNTALCVCVCVDSNSY